MVTVAGRRSSTSSAASRAGSGERAARSSAGRFDLAREVLAWLAAGNYRLEPPIQRASARAIREPAHHGILGERFRSDALELPQHLGLKLIPQTFGDLPLRHCPYPIPNLWDHDRDERINRLPPPAFVTAERIDSLLNSGRWTRSSRPSFFARQRVVADRPATTSSSRPPRPQLARFRIVLSDLPQPTKACLAGGASGTFRSFRGFDNVYIRHVDNIRLRLAALAAQP
jgi:hypothetical protein